MSRRIRAGGHLDLGLGRWAALIGGLVLVACASAPPGESAHPPFWRVHAPGGGELHLLGSIHVGPEEGWRFAEAVEGAFADAAVLVVEIDDRTISAEEIAVLFGERGRLPPGVELTSVLEPETLAKLDERLLALGVPREHVMGLEPWAVSTMLAVAEYQAQGYSDATGVDRRFLDRAGDDVRVVPLETFAEQLDALASLPRSVGERLLLDTLETPSDGEGGVQPLVDAWRRGDDATLETLLFPELSGDEGLEPLYEAVYYARNRRMSRKLAEIARAGEPAFAVVGAGHLVGDLGIPALLAEDGLLVLRIGENGRAAEPLRRAAAR